MTNDHRGFGGEGVLLSFLKRQARLSRKRLCRISHSSHAFTTGSRPRAARLSETFLSRSAHRQHAVEHGRLQGGADDVLETEPEMYPGDCGVQQGHRQAAGAPKPVQRGH